MTIYLKKYQGFADNGWRYGERKQVSDGSRAARFRLYCLIALAFLSIPSQALMAAPETWYNPIVTGTGSAGSEFGSALACSSQNTLFSHSLIAVGAPQANSGEGRVHIYGPSGLIKTLTSPNLLASGNFGYAVRFITDLNGDYEDDLVIGEPFLDGTDNGRIHVYLSTGVPAEPYSICGTQTGSSPVTFGSFIVQTDLNLVTPRIVVATRDSAQLDTFDLTQSMGLCTITPSSDYEGGGSGGATSRYGQSVGYMDTFAGANRLIVGAPREFSNRGGYT